MNNLFYPSKTESEKQKFEQKLKKDLQKLIEVYVGYYGEEYRKQIEGNISSATFIHIGDTKGIEILDDKTLIPRFVNSVEEKLYDEFRKKYKIEDDYLAEIITGTKEYTKEQALIIDKWLETDLSLFDFYKKCDKMDQHYIQFTLYLLDKIQPKGLITKFIGNFFDFSHRKSYFDKLEPILRKLRTDWLELYSFDEESKKRAMESYSVDICKHELKYSSDMLASKIFGTEYPESYRLVHYKKLDIDYKDLDTKKKLEILISAKFWISKQDDDKQFFLSEELWDKIDMFDSSGFAFYNNDDLALIDKGFDEFIYHSKYTDKIKLYLDKVIEREKIIHAVCDEVYQDHIYDFKRLYVEIEEICNQREFFFNERGLKILQEMLEQKPDENGFITGGFVSDLERVKIRGLGGGQFSAIYEDSSMSTIIHEINHLISPTTALSTYLNEIFTEYVACSVAEKAQDEGVTFGDRENDKGSAYSHLFCLVDIFEQYKDEFIEAYLGGDITELKNVLGENLDTISDICNEYFKQRLSPQERKRLISKLENVVKQILVDCNQKKSD